MKGACTLTNAPAVKKPAGTPCQITISAGAFVYDPANPACPATAPAPATVNGMKIAISPDGKTMTLTSNGGSAVITLAPPNIQIQQITPMADSAGSPIIQKSTTNPDTSNGPPVVKNQVVEYQNGQGDGATSGQQPNLSSSIDCSMISSCDWAKSSIQEQQYQLQQQQAQTETDIKTNTGTIASVLQSIRDFINPPAIPDPDLTTKKTPNESVPVALDGSDSFMGGTAGCPPPLEVHFTLGNQTGVIPLTYEPLCLFASYMRPFFILPAYMAAAFIIFRN